MNNTNRNLVRVDRNVAYNISDFSLIKDDPGLIKSLIYYFCYSYQNNFFGYGVLDPAHFGKIFSYSTNYLSSRIDNPAQLKNSSEEEIKKMRALEKSSPEERIFDSRLENALYILSTEPVNFSNSGNIRDFDSDRGFFFRKISSMIFIEELEVRFTRPKSGKGKEKILYYYQLNKEFIKNLSNYYLKANSESFVKLRKSNVDDLYIHLITAKTNLSTKGINVYKPKFDKLWEMTGKIREEKREQKRELKKSLEKIITETELKFELNWECSPNSKYTYQPIITFENLNSNLKAIEDDKKLEKREVFSQNLIREMLEVMKQVRGGRYHSTERENNFLNWMRDNNLDKREKGLAYEQAQLNTYLKIPVHIDMYKHSFFKKITPTSTLKEIFEDINVSEDFPTQEYIIS